MSKALAVATDMRVFPECLHESEKVGEDTTRQLVCMTTNLRCISTSPASHPICNGNPRLADKIRFAQVSR